jgi:hypothetical protein
VVNVDGCDLKAPVVLSAGPGSHKHDGPVAPQPCTFDVGADMNPALTAWLNDSLQGHGTMHDAQLVRLDARPGYALDLPHAAVAEVTLPRIDRAALKSLFLHVALTSDVVRRVPATATIAGLVRPLVPSSLILSVAGRPVPGTSSVGPWTGLMKANADVGVQRESAASHTVDLGDLPIRVAETPGTLKSADVAAWAQEVLVNGQTGADQERPVTVSVSGLTLALGNTAPDRADLVPRADGARTYDLYAETAGLTSVK